MNYRFKVYALTAGSFGTLLVKALSLTVIVFFALPLHALARFVGGRDLPLQRRGAFLLPYSVTGGRWKSAWLVSVKTNPLERSTQTNLYIWELSAMPSL
jgi:hypothetical protein